MIRVLTEGVRRAEIVQLQLGDLPAEHTFASDWLEGGGSEGDLMRLMGRCTDGRATAGPDRSFRCSFRRKPGGWGAIDRGGSAVRPLLPTAVAGAVSPCRRGGRSGPGR
jgi:hypothetical protein